MSVFDIGGSPTLGDSLSGFHELFANRDCRSLIWNGGMRCYVRFSHRHALHDVCDCSTDMENMPVNYQED